MKENFAPRQQGLYHPQYEHDACGIGLIANIEGEKSNLIIRQALTVLKKLSHRGAVGSETTSGDGAGILFQLPHAFNRKICRNAGIQLPEAGDYGTGLVFLPTNPEIRAQFEKEFEAIIEAEGQLLLGWRDVPVNASGLGKTAYCSMPFMRQVFIGRNKAGRGMDFERKLYLIRKKTKGIRQSEFSDQPFYLPSLSSRTIVYKGMLMSEQLDEFFVDLLDEEMKTALALVHSRYSTNTFPSWERAHPNRCIIHNGEINTLRGNVNAMDSRQFMLKSAAFEGQEESLLPIISKFGSDSSSFDNVAEFLMLSGMPIEQVMMLMIPEPWANHESMSAEKKAFYEFNSCLMEPWDGPVAIGFTDGVKVGAVLDRNGLRPARYYVTTDHMVILASEVGVLDIPAEKIIKKERLHPGRMLLIDTENKRIIEDEEIKHSAAAQHPYREWLDANMIALEALPAPEAGAAPLSQSLSVMQKAFGYSYEDLRMFLAPMVVNGVDPVGAMGNDTPLAILSRRPQLMYEYFKQLFAQVTNPPIDALREHVVTSSIVMLGSESNLLSPSAECCRRIKLEQPILDNESLAKLKAMNQPGFKVATLPILFKAGGDGEAMGASLDTLFASAEKAVLDGANILILSDRGVDAEHAAIPALLAVSGLNQHLVRKGLRTRASIVLESGEPREVHHFACLIGYGAAAINPYLALYSIEAMVEEGYISGYPQELAIQCYIETAYEGVIKILSKMGISTIQSYMGAQIFQALGLSPDFVERYFTSTPAPVGSAGIHEISIEAEQRHEAAYGSSNLDDELESSGNYQYRKNGEYHLFNPETISRLQRSVRTGNYELFKEYSKSIHENARQQATLRALMRFKAGRGPIPLEEVESVESICKRFKVGAMSFGSISKEAHETIAIAMNRIGGKSNTGEGGEDPDRYIPDENGDSRCSATKQVASGRFGVTSEYLVNSKEIQIKIAQGAKPGEGGQLPALKVYPAVAKVRHSTPGVGLISPPPHHDIYSIEDLKELIFDLKNANPQARINVKLVSEAGVGTVAAGVAKGFADVILISGYDGGTGASPRTSMRHAGLPWEVGLAETHQTLLLNNLRNRVVLETDGKLMTGRDVAIAALLGAEEFGFATAPLVTLGCVMMRTCNLDNCPVGVATNNPELRKKFAGEPQHIIHFMHFVAQELREIMASLGLRTIHEMVGRTELLDQDTSCASWKASALDLSPILYKPKLPEGAPLHQTVHQDHGLEKTLDMSVLVTLCEPAIQHGHPVEADLPIHNSDRAAGTLLGSMVTRKYGSAGLPDNTIRLRFKGSCGQSFGAFVPKGITLSISGDANDYVGKGLSGGRIIITPPAGSRFVPEENIIIGNVALYGATSGEAYFRGAAGERFCVRNSGAKAVVESVGDHGCEYMTGGRVAVLGKTGRNFAAGMSGGVAYVYDEDGTFASRCNTEMVELTNLDEKGAAELKQMVGDHLSYTGSDTAKAILADWDRSLAKFVRVMPIDYKRMMEALDKAYSDGYTGDEALTEAFETNKRNLMRANGK